MEIWTSSAWQIPAKKKKKKKNLKKLIFVPRAKLQIGTLEVLTRSLKKQERIWTPPSGSLQRVWQTDSDSGPLIYDVFFGRNGSASQLADQTSRIVLNVVRSNNGHTLQTFLCVFKRCLVLHKETHPDKHFNEETCTASSRQPDLGLHSEKNSRKKLKRGM